MIFYYAALEDDHLFSTNFLSLIHCFPVPFPALFLLSLNLDSPSAASPDGSWSQQHLPKPQDLRWKTPEKNVELAHGTSLSGVSPTGLQGSVNFTREDGLRVWI